jgi:hypothetical protein
LNFSIFYNFHTRFFSEDLTAGAFPRWSGQHVRQRVLPHRNIGDLMKPTKKIPDNYLHVATYDPHQYWKALWILFGIAALITIASFLRKSVMSHSKTEHAAQRQGKQAGRGIVI